jgi:carbon-monoxide dehydrogenase large subunit
VAVVVAEDRYSARDALELVEVTYEPLEPVIDPRRALDPDAPQIRDERTGDDGNRAFEWSTGDRAATQAVFDRADVVVSQDLVFPRVHPVPLETCACIAELDDTTGRLTVWSTTQAPHAHRSTYADLTGIPEHMIRVIAPDVGGGFGNKVPIYPGYLCTIVAALVTGRPVKWTEDRNENLVTTSFARDYSMHGEIASTADGRILGLRSTVLADHGAFNAMATPADYPAGFFGVFTGSYDIEAAYANLVAVHTNKAPGGVAYACSFRISEAVYLVERMVDRLAAELGMDPCELRLKNLLRAEQFPYTTKTGWVFDSGDYEPALRMAMDSAGYHELRAEQERKPRNGELMGIGVSFFTEAVGAGPRAHMNMAGLGMADGCELEIHPTGTAVLRIAATSQGQGHETTFAQVVSEILGLAVDDIAVVQGDTDTSPVGVGTFGSRSTPVSGAAATLLARRLHAKATEIAAHMLEAAPADIESRRGTFWVRGVPSREVSIREVARQAYGSDLPPGVESGLSEQIRYDPENLTYPFGAYLCVVDVDPATGVAEVRRFIAVDDCGTHINPTIVDGQVQGGLTEGLAIALMQEIVYDEDGNCLTGTLMDYVIPTALETPRWETMYTHTPSPHHPLGAKGIGECATVGSPPAFVNAVVDALAPFGVRHVDMPLTPARVWEAIHGDGS